ncbi:hypothetical protein [Mesorhizobium sp.]|uniref:hypothetical protein n=1 Tax=Mesorhizobium sp. TaxID=1871066 RepID=UPI000FD4C15B|nr:hypothetical protein [Mesorhizobium sp.]RVC62549.1 hypothetical protein EN779_07485 [Mesorhizobium sp. M4B.F.Ca.ET.088.02.2.1]RWF25848.1 MAG: hypothetical protein EOS45_29850 [Mesorhizobium sp.]
MTDNKPDVTNVALAGSMADELPGLAGLGGLVQPPDGRVAIQLDDGLRVFAPAGTTAAAIKRQHACKQKVS